jgi:DNA repair exonuclease SbcCD ATPase subunit
MDLFNPPRNFNYKNMPNTLNVQILENPYVQVVWEDLPENFTTERIKSVKTYFENKYKSKNVNVVTKVKTQGETTQSVDVSLNILDENYQQELIVKFLENGNNTKLKESILELNKVVESKISVDKAEITPFKKWYIKKIEFSNFLSFGDNQTLNFESLKGISTIESNPPNFGGKTVLTVDLLMFLFFNTTTKTSKAEEIFNRFRNVDKVGVRGEITIDGEDYIIARMIERKLSKKGEWNVKTELDFFKKLADGSLQNFTGEQRRETETFIKNSIGTMDDFLTTILTTSSNLEDLIDSKPTARGQVLSRFLGLDSLKTKEDAAKELYSSFSKGMVSNIYNTETLKNEIETYQGLILEEQNKIKESKEKLKDVLDRIQLGISFRDELLKKKHTDIDPELLKINPQLLINEIKDFENKILQTNNQIKEIKVVEPTQFYHEDKHDEVKREINDLNIQVAQFEIQIDGLEKLKSEVSGGVKCGHCGIELMNASITQSRIAELDGFMTQKNEKIKLKQDFLGKELEFTQLKKDFDEYEKNKLIREKYEAQVESQILKKTESETKLKKFEDSKTRLEENRSIDERIMRADLKLNELNSEKDSYILQEKTSELSIEKHKEKIDNNNKTILKIAEEFEKEKIYKVYLEIFGKNGISKMIMKTMMPVINSELQRLLSDSAEFKLEVQINDKNEVEFIMIDNSTQIEKLMSSGSGYERTIASLALRAVLSKVCSLPKPNIIVFDEVFGKVSNENLERVGEFFVKIKTYFDKILIITHNPLVSNFADGIVRITKENNISKVSQ